MSLTSAVPATVPSVFHNSTPCCPSSAVKYSSPPDSVNLAGSELSVLVLMSLTSETLRSVRRSSGSARNGVTSARRATAARLDCLLIGRLRKGNNRLGRQRETPPRDRAAYRAARG